LIDLATGYKPMFHYLVVKRSGGSLQVVSYQLANDFNSFNAGMTMTIDQQATEVIVK
jgi:hypothetical protein